MIPIEKLRAIPTENLMALNRAVVDEIKHRRSMEAQRKVRAFVPGQLATFQSKYGYPVRIRITQINRVTVSGDEVDSAGNRTFRTWRVHPSALRAVV